MIIQACQNAVEVQDSAKDYHDMKYLVRATPDIESSWIETFR